MVMFQRERGAALAGLVAEGSRVYWCECESLGRRRVLQDTRLVRVRQAWLAVAALSREGTTMTNQEQIWRKQHNKANRL